VQLCGFVQLPSNEYLHLPQSSLFSKERKLKAEYENCYRYTFVATCPTDGDSVVYTLEILSSKKILVEHIRTAVALQNSGHQEEIADELLRQLGGRQRIVATHRGVEIETWREERQ